MNSIGESVSYRWYDCPVPGKIELECRICTVLDDEFEISSRLQNAIPSFTWEDGDSSWDKVRVWGESADGVIRIYRYESPGPFRLTISLQPELDLNSILQQILEALNARVWKALEPQPVELVARNGTFPAAYDFDCALAMDQIYKFLTDTDLWFWELLRQGSMRYIAGRVTGMKGSTVRITGEPLVYRIELGALPNEVHETVQTTILPALGARNVRPAADGVDQ